MNLEPLFAFEISASRKTDPSKYPDVKPWIPKAIDEEDQRPKTQLWSGEPTEDAQKVARLRRIRFFRKYEDDNPLVKAIADRLVACRKGNRCCSGACPECGWLLQRWFVRTSEAFISDVIDKHDQSLVAISIVPSDPIIRPCKLRTLSIKNFRRRLKYALGKAEIGTLAGGIDFSFNEDRDDRYKPYWSPHFYLITSVTNKEHVKRLLKQIFKPDLQIPKPVKISDFSNSAWRRSYIFKIVFSRRVSYRALKVKNGVVRKCRNTSGDKLRNKEKLELFVYLDQVGLAGRFIFRSAKPAISSDKVRIRSVKASYQGEARKRQKNKNNSIKTASLDDGI